jgi:hypothetical protein
VTTLRLHLMCSSCVPWHRLLKAEEVSPFASDVGSRCSQIAGVKLRSPKHIARDATEMCEANPKVNNVRNNRAELPQQAERAAESGLLPL